MERKSGSLYIGWCVSVWMGLRLVLRFRLVPRERRTQGSNYFLYSRTIRKLLIGYKGS